MANNLTTITKGCDNNLGGFNFLMVNDSDNVSGKSINTLTHTITGITASDYTEFYIQKNISSVEVDTPSDFNTGANTFTATVNVIFNRREAQKSLALQILSAGQRYLDIIYRDLNGIYWNIPNAQLSNAAESTGTVRTDGSKYTVTFIAELDNRPYAVDPTIIPALIS